MKRRTEHGHERAQGRKTEEGRWQGGGGRRTVGHLRHKDVKLAIFHDIEVVATLALPDDHLPWRHVLLHHHL